MGTVIAKYLEASHEIEIVDLKNGRDYRNINEFGFDAVVHLAAIVGDQACREDQVGARETNFRGVVQFINALQKTNVRRFIFASTCSVYGQDSIANCCENGRVNPLSLYATTKFAAEKSVINSESDTFHPTILRFGTAFGQSPSMRYNLVLNKFAKDIRTKNKITIFGGDQYRPFIHVTDIARAIKLVLEAPVEVVSGEIFNIANENIKMKYLGYDITEWFLCDIAFNYEITDKRTYKVSTEKARNLLGFEPQVIIREGMKEMINNV